MNRRPNNYLADRVMLSYEHAQATADTAIKLWAPDKAFRVDRVFYNNPTGLATSATDFFDIQILKDATVVANWSTETGQEGTLTADTSVDLSLSATAANLVFAAGDELILNLDETGTATLPAGRIVIEGRYL